MEATARSRGRHEVLRVAEEEADRVDERGRRRRAAQRNLILESTHPDPLLQRGGCLKKEAAATSRTC